MARFTINDAGYQVTAANAASAVAKDLRDAGYKARVVGGEVVIPSSAEHLAGVQRVHGAGRTASVTVRVAEGGASGRGDVVAKLAKAQAAR